MTGSAITADGLAKSFGDLHAVRGIDLDVQRGEIFGFLGRNGSGKTTTVRLLTTLARPTAGRATVGGHDVVASPGAVHSVIGVTMQDAALDPVMEARDHLVLSGRLWGLGKHGARRRAEELLELFGLTGEADRRIATYSGGMQRRLDIATSLIGDPEILFLDEPTTGLDPQSRRALWAEIRRLQTGGVTVFLTTQYLEEADELADRLAVIDDGAIIAEGTPAALKAEYGHRTVGVPASVELGGLDAVAPGAAVDRRNGTTMIGLGRDVAIEPVLDLVRERLGSLAAVTISEPDLEDVFIGLTGNDITVSSTTPEDQPA